MAPSLGISQGRKSILKQSNLRGVVFYIFPFVTCGSSKRLMLKKKNRHSKPTKIEGTPFPFPRPFQKTNGMVNPDLPLQLLMEKKKSPGNWTGSSGPASYEDSSLQMNSGWIGPGSFYWLVSLMNRLTDMMLHWEKLCLHSTMILDDLLNVGFQFFPPLSSSGLGIEMGLLNATLKKQKKKKREGCFWMWLGTYGFWRCGGTGVCWVWLSLCRCRAVGFSNAAWVCMTQGPGNCLTRAF